MMFTLCAESAPCQYCLTFILTDYVAFVERLSECLWDYPAMALDIFQLID